MLDHDKTRPSFPMEGNISGKRLKETLGSTILAVTATTNWESK